jgi:hypothetical protein
MDDNTAGVSGGSNEQESESEVQRRAAACVSDFEVHLVPGLEHKVLDLVCQRLDLTTAAGNRGLAYYLADMPERGQFIPLGYESAVHYACMRLGMSASHARDLVLVGRALERLLDVDAAFAAGRINWSKARLLGRVATVETQ